MSLFDQLRKNKTVAMIGIAGAALGGIGGVLIGGTGAAAGALAVAGSIAGLTAGTYLGNMITGATDEAAPPQAAATPAAGATPAQGEGPAPAQDLGSQAMSALQAAPAKLLMAGLNQGAQAVTGQAVGPGGVPLLKPDFTRIS